MSQTFLTNSSCKGVDLEPIALVGHDAVLTRGRRSTKEGGALLTQKPALILTIILVLTIVLFGCEQKGNLTETIMTIKQLITADVLPGQENLYAQYQIAIIKTNYGNITVELYGNESPITVNNFLNLAKKGFYNNTKLHRVIKSFMIQGGDPNSRDRDISKHGLGGPGYKFQDEINNHKLVRGSLAMANAGPNTNGSQFFIVTKDATPWLDGQHTNFGRVIAGMDVVDKIESVQVDANDHPRSDIVIEGVELK
jgi:Peptidyl-prolyl cis-trans isomerase (rotamase) - cyclophilin family